MEKALEILKHIEELYANDPDTAKIEKMAIKNPERVGMWEQAFKDYDLTDVLLAIDKYWEFKSNKSRPSVAQLKATLNAREVERKDTSNHDGVKYINPANEFMQRDINLGTCRHTFSEYNEAVNYIINDLLREEMPVSEWVNMDYSKRYNQAMKKGLFNEFDNVLIQVCRKRYGKDYVVDENYKPTNLENITRNLASHYRTDDVFDLGA